MEAFSDMVDFVSQYYELHDIRGLVIPILAESWNRHVPGDVHPSCLDRAMDKCQPLQDTMLGVLAIDPNLLMDWEISIFVPKLFKPSLQNHMMSCLLHGHC